MPAFLVQAITDWSNATASTRAYVDSVKAGIASLQTSGLSGAALQSSTRSLAASGQQVAASGIASGALSTEQRAEVAAASAKLQQLSLAAPTTQPQLASILAQQEATARETLRLQATAAIEAGTSTEAQTAVREGLERQAQAAAALAELSDAQIAEIAEANALRAEYNTRVTEAEAETIAAAERVARATSAQAQKAAVLVNLTEEQIQQEGETAAILAAHRARVKDAAGLTPTPAVAAVPLTAEEKVAAATAAQAEKAAVLVNLTDEQVVLVAQSNKDIAEYNARVKAAQAALATPAGPTANPSRFQRAMGYAHGNDASEQPGLGQFFSGRALSSAAYGAAAIVIYGAYEELRKSFDEATKLQQTLALVQGEFQSLGQGSQFPQMVQSIQEISRDTGILGSEVAQVALQEKGVWGSTTAAINETDAAMKYIKVTGQDVAQAVNDLTAVTTTWKITNQQASDTVLVLQDRTGVMAKEILNGVGIVAPVAQQLGLTFQQTAGLIASASQASGRDAQAIAENFNRILPAMQKSASQLVAIFQTIPAVSKDAAALAGDFGRGDYGAALQILIQDWSKLTSAQQAATLEMVGGRREANALAAVLEQPSKTLELMNGNLNATGRTQEAFQKQMASLRGEMNQFHQTLVTIGQDIISGPLGQAFTDLVHLLTEIAKYVQDVASAFDILDRASGRLLTQLTEIVLALKALQVLGGLKLFSGLVGGGAAGGLLGGAEGAGVGALLSRLLGRGGSGLGAAATGGLQVTQVRSLATGELVSAFGTSGAVAAGAAGAAGAGRLARAGTAVRGLGTAAGGLFGADLAGGAALAAGLGTAGLGIGLLAAYDYFSKQNKEKTQQFATTLSAMSDQEINRQISQLQGQTGFFSTDWHNIIPGWTSGKKADLSSLLVEQARRKLGGQADMIQTLLASSSIQPKDADQLNKAIADAAAGTITPDELSGAENTLHRIKNSQWGRTALQQATQLTQEQADVYKAINDQTGLGLQNLSDLQTAYQDGSISAGQYLDALNKQVTLLQQQVANGLTDSVTMNALAQAEKARTDALSTMAKTSTDLAVKIDKLRGGGPASEASIYVHAIQTPGIDESTKVQFAESALQAEQAAFNEALSHAKTAEEINKILSQGIQIDPAVTAALLSAQVQADPTYAGLLDQGTELGAIVDSVVGASNSESDRIDKIAALATRTHQSIATVLKGIIQNEINDIEAVLNTASVAVIPGLEAALSDLQNALSILNSAPDYAPTTTGQPDPAQTQQAAISAAQKVASEHKAWYDWLKQADALNPGKAAADAVKEARQAVADAQYTVSQGGDPALLAQAQTELVKANQDMAKAIQAQTDSHFGLLEAAAKAAGNGLQAAEYAVQKAKYDLTQYIAQGGSDQGEIDKLNSDITNTEAEVQKQLQAQIDAHFGLLEAQAKAGGNTIAAAKDAYAKAKSDLGAYIAQGGHDQGELDKLNTDVVNTAAAVRDATLSTDENKIDTALQLEKITAAQAIAQFEALLKIPNLTADQTNQILLKIKQLRDELGKDLQFDIPSDINLPTLYEVRRSLADQRAGVGYQDNRNVYASITVNTGMDQAGATQFLADAAGAPVQVVSTLPRKY